MKISRTESFKAQDQLSPRIAPPCPAHLDVTPNTHGNRDAADAGGAREDKRWDAPLGRSYLGPRDSRVKLRFDGAV